MKAKRLFCACIMRPLVSVTQCSAVRVAEPENSEGTEGPEAQAQAQALAAKAIATALIGAAKLIVASMWPFFFALRPFLHGHAARVAKARGAGCKAIAARTV